MYKELDVIISILVKLPIWNLQQRVANNKISLLPKLKACLGKNQVPFYSRDNARTLNTTEKSRAGVNLF